MRRRKTTMVKLAVGTACWLAAGMLVLGYRGEPRTALADSLLQVNWQMSSPEPNATYPQSGQVDGLGNGPANTDCAFAVTEHGNFDEIVASKPTQTDEFGMWAATLLSTDSQSGKWPLGMYNAVIFEGQDPAAHKTIFFVEDDP